MYCRIDFVVHITVVAVVKTKKFGISYTLMESEMDLRLSVISLAKEMVFHCTFHNINSI